MLKLDKETKDVLENAKLLLRMEMKNVGYLLNEIGNKDNSIAKVTGANVFAAGSEMLVLQILENLDRSFLLISIIALRTLFENYINVHYIYHHPKHLEDKEWAEVLCKDYIKRTIDPYSQKNRIGEKSLYQRAKVINAEDLSVNYFSSLIK
ncbi:MAG TPA: hypothetical protein VFD10_10705 [Atribacterota bacterium]|nr:hypothetical protein [Atribacterota bacterium]